jgi:hypothetical protein
LNIFQAANGAATFLILSAIVAGLAKYFDSIRDGPIQDLLNRPEILLLGLFIVVFRIKTLLDDHKHFAESYQDKSAFRYVGFVLAVISWIFWGIGGYLLPSTARASEMMAVSILISTLWVAAHIIEILVDKVRRNTESLTSIMREKWVVINLLYMLLLVAHDGWFRPIVPLGAKTPLIFLLVLLAFDVLTSRSLRDVTKPNPPA